MSTHAELSPSSAARWMLCPGSVALCRGLPGTSSAHANEGSDMHELAATCLTMRKDAADFHGTTLNYGTVVDNEIAAAVQAYVNTIRDIVGATHKSSLLVEQSLSIEHLTGEPGAKGTSDAVILTDDELIIVDAKFGRGVAIDAAGNPQLRIYGLAALNEYGLGWDFDTVRLIIHQPRLGSVTEEVLTVAELEAFGEDVRAAAEATRQPNAPFVPAEQSCRWCKAKATCPALRDAVLADFEAVEPPSASEDALATSMAMVEMVEMWAKAVRAETERRLLAGQPVRGWKLVQGKRGNRRWADEKAAEDMLRNKFRLPIEVAYDLSVISPTSAEKLAKEGVIGPKRWPKLQELITQAEGRPSVAPESDKRPALVMSAVDDDFDDVTDLA